MNSRDDAVYKRRAYFEQARFFAHVPARTLDSLNTTQRRDIAHTIFELQRSNPRVLQELYLENPFVSQDKGSRIMRRIKRRFYLIARTLWFTLVDAPAERRRDHRLADLIFLLIMTTLSTSFILGLVLFIYFLKSAAGVDLLPGMHLFCTDG